MGQLQILIHWLIPPGKDFRLSISRIPPEQSITAVPNRLQAHPTGRRHSPPDHTYTIILISDHELLHGLSHCSFKTCEASEFIQLL